MRKLLDEAEKSLYRDYDGYYRDFEGYDRLDFPEPLYRVTAGPGGDAILIMGSEKSALYDCGMSCFGDGLVSNIKRVFSAPKFAAEGRKLDYVFLSHTHYDHMGALPYIVKEWPDVCVCGSEKALKVFKSEKAMQTMLELGKNAGRLYGVSGEVTVEGIRLDKILGDNDSVSLGDTEVEAFITKGHTDCSLSYMIHPGEMLLMCESTGIQTVPGLVQTSALKSFRDTIESAEKLKNLDFRILISSHYGVLPEWRNKEYFDDYKEAAITEMNFMIDLVKRGSSAKEVADAHSKIYWDPAREKFQPYAAYRLNTEIIAARLVKSFEAGEL